MEEDSAISEWEWEAMHAPGPSPWRLVIVTIIISLILLLTVSGRHFPMTFRFSIDRDCRPVRYFHTRFQDFLINRWGGEFALKVAFFRYCVDYTFLLYFLGISLFLSCNFSLVNRSRYFQHLFLFHCFTQKVKVKVCRLRLTR